MSNAVEIARMLTTRQRQVLEMLVNAERPLRNKDFHERFETGGRRTTGWAKALGPCTKARNHDPASLWARGLVTVTDNRCYKITPVGREVAAVIESVVIRPTVRRKRPCAEDAPAIGSSTPRNRPKVTPVAERLSKRLTEFRLQIQKIEKSLPSGTSWPFLCSGSPLMCRIFIVGINPARKVEKPFWDFFWTDTRGCRRTEFVRELENLDGGYSRTRKNMRIVVETAGKKDTMETNIYPYAARSPRDLLPEQKRTDIFEWLLHRVKPQIVLAHGVPAKKFFKRHCRDFVESSVTPQKVTWDAWQWHFRLLCSHHLSFQGKKGKHAEEAERIGQVLAGAIH